MIGDGKSRTAAAVAAGAVALLAGSGQGGELPLAEWRSIDGSGNNLANPEWGSTGEAPMRMTAMSYEDEVSEPSGADRPNPRAVSNAVNAQPGLIFNSVSASDYLWQWGQFIDHDITLVDVAIPLEPLDIPVPPGDPFFDPDGTGEQWILFDRSAYLPGSGEGPGNPREQMQFLTAFIDGSQVYGSDAKRAAALRTLDGTGRLKTSAGNLLPFNVDGLPNLGGPDPSLFLAGDIRANEQLGLTCMHTLFVREHNRLADLLRFIHPDWSGEEVYQAARALVGAEIQAITYNEFLPLLLGPDAFEPYGGWDSDVNPSIANVFATVAYRVGHTLLSPVLARLDANGNSIGDVELRDAFFGIQFIMDDGIEPVLRGLASKPAQEIDRFIVDDVRNFLFGAPGQGGFDLASLNIQRGRDHGLPGYNQVRVDMGLEPVTDFADITSDPAAQQALADAYGDVNLIDPWVGGLAEDHVEGAMVGELLHEVITHQFARLRDGDRFFYRRIFQGQIRDWVDSVRLADVIRWNTNISVEIPDDVFIASGFCPADLNGDGEVNVEDLVELILAWDQTDSPADLDGDGVVGVPDLVELVLSFGEC